MKFIWLELINSDTKGVLTFNEIYFNADDILYMKEWLTFTEKEQSEHPIWEGTLIYTKSGSVLYVRDTLPNIDYMLGGEK